MFFWNSLSFSMIQQMLAIWSLVPLPFLKPGWTSGSSRFTYCWSLAWRILSITLLTCEMSQLCSSLSVNWDCLSLGLEWKLTFLQSCGCIDIYNCYVFLLGWSLYYYVMSFLISCNLYFKVYFVCYEDCYSSFLLLPIYVEYIFPSSHFSL